MTVGVNSIVRLGGGRCALFYANRLAVTNINIFGLQVVGRVEFARDTDHIGTFTGVSINGLVSTGVANGQIPLTLTAVSKAVVSGSVLEGSNTYGVSLVVCTSMRLTGNAIKGGLITSGVCTGSHFDKSNSVGGDVDNIATGLIVEQLATAAPAYGTAAVGDRREQSAPSSGQPKGWRCTVAGAPGTWSSEGNL